VGQRGIAKHEVLSSFEDWRAKSREKTLRRSGGRWERVRDDGGSNHLMEQDGAEFE
jgi:hypothetical protein